MRRFNSQMSPGLVHLYMTRASWPRRWMGWAYATSVRRRLQLRRLTRCRWKRNVSRPAQMDRVVTDRGVTTRGDDGRSQRRVEPPGGEFGERKARRGDLPAAIRRRAAHRERPRGR